MRSCATIINNVVDGGPALHVPGHLSFGQCIIDKLRENCQDGDEVALVNGVTGEKMTYRNILQNVVNVATGLKNLGVKRGDVVALCSENRDEFLYAAIAAICCGATITTANLQYTRDELVHIFNISKPNILFCSEEALKVHNKTFKSLSFIKKIIQFGETPAQKGVLLFGGIAAETDINEYEPEQVRGWSDTAFILYSSGTTGLPKGVMLSHLNLLYAFANFQFEADLRDGTAIPKLLTLVPWFHAYGLMSTINYIGVKCPLVYFSHFDPIKYLSAIQEHKVTVLLVVPPLVVFLAKAPLLEEFDLSSVTHIWCGAAPLSSETINQTLKRLPNCKGIFQAYGMTETSLVATKDDHENVNTKPGSGGVPIRGVKVKVVDVATRKKLGPRQEGEVCIKGPLIMQGYCGNKAATQDILDPEGYLKTGDIGYYDEQGHFFIVDRLKELIKYKGNQVPPASVENILLQHPSVAECGVVGTPDEAAGELPTAFVALKPDSNVTEKDILNFVNSRLSPEKRLYGGVIFVDAIPKNPSGKILRRVLKQQLKQKHKKSKL